VSEGFSRTLQTAAEAEATAKLLEGVAEGHRVTYTDRERLLALAARYTAYSDALRETAGEDRAAPEPDQGALSI
jgi:hypothetical protein